MTNAHPEENILIQANDVISVPRADIVYVVGEVKKAGGFPLNERENLTVLQAVSLAEGLQPTAAPAASNDGGSPSPLIIAGVAIALVAVIAGLLTRIRR